MGEAEAWARERNKAGGRSQAVLLSFPGPTPVATGAGQSFLVCLLLVLWVLCFTAECFCVQFHSASDSQSFGVELLVFSKSRC